MHLLRSVLYILLFVGITAGLTACGGGGSSASGNVCGDPALANPAAFEVSGNGVDDDCDGVVDNAIMACDSALPSNSADPMHYAAAMGLCQIGDSTQWGVTSASLTLPSGSGTPNPNSRAIRPDFGQTVVQSGDSMVVLSTGHAADTSDTNPGFAAFQGGEDMGTSSSAPSDWLAANGNQFPNPSGCPAATSTVANDPVMLELTIKVPSNARSFSFASNFFSSEYPEWVCSEYNDFFVVLLDSAYAGTPANPADKNLALYTDPSTIVYPVGVNLAFGDTGLFRVCLNGDTGCGLGAVSGTTTSCISTATLSGTGFDQVNGGGCGASELDGGGTGWLTVSGNVVGGETIVLRIAIWDTNDHVYDSVVLLDNFQWSVDPTTPGTVALP